MTRIFGLGLCFASLFALFLMTGVAYGQSACTVSSVQGPYGFAGAGFVPQKLQSSVRFDPISQVGLANYNGNGSLTVILKTQYHGTTGTATLTGTYEIAANCTGTVKFTNSAGTVVTSWDFVLVGKGEEIETVALMSEMQSRPMYSTVFRQKKL